VTPGARIAAIITEGQAWLFVSRGRGCALRTDEAHALDERCPASSLLVHHLVHALARDIEVLGEARLVPALKRVPGDEMADGYAKLIDAFLVPAHWMFLIDYAACSIILSRHPQLPLSSECALVRAYESRPGRTSEFGAVIATR
jgi:hypothetical protein